MQYRDPIREVTRPPPNLVRRTNDCGPLVAEFAILVPDLPLPGDHLARGLVEMRASASEAESSRIGSRYCIRGQRVVCDTIPK